MQRILFIFGLGSSLLLATDKAHSITAGNPNSDARKVTYHSGQAITLYGQYGWQSVAILPSSEKVLDYFCGNKDDWDVHVPKKTNFVTVEPNKAGVRDTDLQLVTASGNVYTFVLSDVSEKSDGHADTQVILNVTDEVMRAAMNEKPKYVLAEDAEAFKEQAARAEEEADKAREQAAKTVEQQTAKARADAATVFQTNYEYDRKAAAKAPFNLTSLFHDDKFTYFKASAEEALSVYAIKDGKPQALNIYPTPDGTVRVDRVVDKGYFRIGKKQLDFQLSE